MQNDIIREYGYLTLGTRLKRLGDQLQMDVQKAIDAVGLPITAAQSPVLAALDQRGALSISDLVGEIGISQPGVTRMIKMLNEKGLVDVKTDPADQRGRLVRLTIAGRNLVAEAKGGLWPVIDAGVEEICAAKYNNNGILESLDAIETALNDNGLYSRMNRIQKSRRGGG